MNRISSTLSRARTYLRAIVRHDTVPLAYISGWLGKENLGDEALFLAIEKLFPGSSLWHFDGSRTHRTLLRFLPFCSNGLLAGGTLISRAHFYLEHFRQFAAQSRRAFVFGTGVADPTFWCGRPGFRSSLDEWAVTLSALSYVGVRGPMSANLLSDAGVTGVTIVGDPALAFARKSIDPFPDRATVGLNVGYDHGNQWGDPELLFEEYRVLALRARNAGWKIRWFVVFPKDLEITLRIAKQVEPHPDIYVNYQDPELFVSEASKVSIFVAMKLHAAILAVCAHRPTLLLEYDPKCLDFMASIGQQESVIRTDKFKGDFGWELLLDWSARLPLIQRKLSSDILRLVSYQEVEANRVSRMFVK